MTMKVLKYTNDDTIPNVYNLLVTIMTAWVLAEGVMKVIIALNKLQNTLSCTCTLH